MDALTVSVGLNIVQAVLLAWVVAVVEWDRTPARAAQVASAGPGDCTSFLGRRQ